MVVAVIPMGMMQVPIDQVIDVIAVGYGRMPTPRAVNVVFIMALADVMNAPGRVGVRDRYHVFVIVAFMGAVKMSVVQVSDMIPVYHGDVTTVRTVLMGVVFVYCVGHGQCPQVTTCNVRRYGPAGYCGLYGLGPIERENPALGRVLTDSVATHPL